MSRVDTNNCRRFSLLLLGIQQVLLFFLNINNISICSSYHNSYNVHHAIKTSSLLRLHMQSQKITEQKEPNNFFTSLIPNNNKKKQQKYDIKRMPIIGRYQNCTISSLGCGTWSWGNRLLYNYNDNQDVELYESYKIVRNAGVTIFDTADSYGTLNYNGRAEILLGQFERQYQSEINNNENNNNNNDSPILRFPWMKSKDNMKSSSNERQVATKLAPYPWRVTRNSFINAAKGSLRRIQEDKVMIAQVHWSTQKYQPFQERTLWEGLCDSYDMNICDAIGVSNYGPKQLSAIQNYIQTERTNIPGIATAQIQYSLLTYADPLTRDMEIACKESNVQLISYSPLCLGLLSGKYNINNVNSIPSLPRRQLFRELIPTSTKLLQTLQIMSNDNNVSVSQIAINWCLCKNTIPIPGCRTIQQAQEMINSATMFRLRTDEINELDSIAIAISKPMIQNIFQTK